MVEDHAATSERIRCVSSAKLAHFLKREPRLDSVTDLDLNRIFRELLKRANDFLPSDAGTIYLDDPLEKTEDANRRSLVVIASFGPKGEDLVEERFDTHKGIIGEVYRSGLPYSCSDPLEDPIFRSGPGLRIGFSIESVVCAPLEVEGRTITNLELLEISLVTVPANRESAIEVRNAMSAIYGDEIAKSMVHVEDDEDLSWESGEASDNLRELIQSEVQRELASRKDKNDEEPVEGASSADTGSSGKAADTEEYEVTPLDFGETEYEVKSLFGGTDDE